MPPDNATRKLPGVLGLPNDDTRKIIAVALILSLVGSLLVSGAAVLLKPLQEHNRALAKMTEIVRVSGLMKAGADDEEIEQLFTQIEARVVNLDTGVYVEDIDPLEFDRAAATRDPATSIELPANQDMARIKRRANHALVYLVHEGKKLKTVILPVHGAGLWATMYGFLALASDGKTITGLTFYQHGETPGLGDRIENPDWQAQFVGKLALDDTGKPRITLVKGGVNASSPDAKYQVDGIAGATLTANGVTHLLQFWLGQQGFGPYLEKLRSSGDPA